MAMFSNQRFAIRLLTSLSHRETCRRLRAALENEGLEVVAEVDLSKHIENHTGLTLQKYTVLTVCSSLETYHALLADPEAGIFLPFHVVVTPYFQKTLVAAVAPEWLGEVVDKLSFRLLAIDASEKYRRALSTLETAKGAHPEAEPKLAVA
jgi:uncharacterized protein (DUF302 family)